MKRTPTCILLAAFGLLCLTAGLARAAQEPTQDPQRDGRAQEPQSAIKDKGDAPTPAPRSPAGRDRVDPQTRHLVSSVLRLQAAVKKEFTLSKEQEAAIEPLFSDYLRELKESQSPRRPFGVDSERTAELKELRKQIAAAQEAGDKETVEKLRNEFSQQLREPSNRAVTKLPKFVDSVASHLGEADRARFRKLARKLGATTLHPSQLNADLFLTWRAVVLPGVNATREQRIEIRDIVREARFELSELYEDQAKAKAVIERVRGEIMQRLTPEQQVKFQEGLANPYQGARPVTVQQPSDKKAPEEPSGQKGTADKTEPAGEKGKEPG